MVKKIVVNEYKKAICNFSISKFIYFVVFYADNCGETLLEVSDAELLMDHGEGEDPQLVTRTSLNELASNSLMLAGTTLFSFTLEKLWN